MKSRHIVLFCLALAALFLFIVPAEAQMFTVTLKNGHTFESRYRPLQSAEDADKIALLTDVGNWIYLSKDEVSSILSNTETRGFGIQIDTSTIALGWAPNDKPKPADGEQETDPAGRLLSYLQEQDESRPVYNVDQFVTTEEAGVGTAGFPASFGDPFGNSSGRQP